MAIIDHTLFRLVKKELVSEKGVDEYMSEMLFKKTKDVSFQKFLELLRAEKETKEISEELAKEHFKKNFKYSVRTAISRTISAVSRQQEIEKYESYEGVVLGSRDFTWKEQQPAQLRQCWGTFVPMNNNEKGALLECKIWGDRIDGKHFPSGHQIVFKGVWTTYQPKGKTTKYINFEPKMFDIKNAIKHQDLITLCQKNAIPISDLKNYEYKTIVSFGVTRWIGGSAIWDGNQKIGEFNFLESRGDNTTSPCFSISFFPEENIRVTVDFTKQKYGQPFFLIADFDEAVAEVLQSANPIQKLREFLRKRKFYWVGNVSSIKDTMDKQGNDFTAVRVRGTALIDVANIPQGFNPDLSADETQKQLDVENEENISGDLVGEKISSIPTGLDAKDIALWVEISKYEGEKHGYKIKTEEEFASLQESLIKLFNAGCIYLQKGDGKTMESEYKPLDLPDENILQQYQQAEGKKKEEKTNDLPKLKESDEINKQPTTLVEKGEIMPQESMDAEQITELAGSSLDDDDITLWKKIFEKQNEGKTVTSKKVNKKNQLGLKKLIAHKKIYVDENDVVKLLDYPPEEVQEAPKTEEESIKDKSKKKMDYLIDQTYSCLMTLGTQATVKDILDSGLFPNKVGEKTMEKLIEQAKKKYNL